MYLLFNSHISKNSKVEQLYLLKLLNGVTNKPVNHDVVKARPHINGIKRVIIHLIQYCIFPFPQFQKIDENIFLLVRKLSGFNISMNKSLRNWIVTVLKIAEKFPNHGRSALTIGIFYGIKLLRTKVLTQLFN